MHSCALRAFENVNASIFYCIPAAFCYTLCVWQYGLYVCIRHLNFLYYSLFLSGWGENYASYAQVRPVPQLFASSSSLSLWQKTLCCQHVAMNFATKNAQDTRARRIERETDSILFTLCRRFYSCKPTLSSRFKAVKLVFCPTKPKWSVFSVVWYGVIWCGVVWCGVLLACGTCCIPHCGT